MSDFDDAKAALVKTVKKVFPTAKKVPGWAGVETWGVLRPKEIATGERKPGTYDPKQIVIGIADRKGGPTVYFLDPGDYFALETHKELLAEDGLTVGRGCIYHTRKGPLPTKALEKLFRLTKKRDAEAAKEAKGAKRPAAKAAAPRSKKAAGKAKDVDSYLAALPGPHRMALERLRKIVRQAAPDAVEVISYGIPTWKHAGTNLVHMAAFTEHCSFFPGTTIERIPKKDIAKWKTSKGTIQFAPNKPLPAPLVKRIVKMRIEENEAIAAKRAQKKR